MSELLPPGPGQRLHPVSVVFVVLGVLREVVAAFVVLVLGVASAGLGALILFALLLLGLLLAAVYGLIRVRNYRYWVEDEAIVIRSGVFDRTVRRVPYQRIQNVNLRRTLVHRLLGVAELRLESASGSESEARMQVLGLDQALALEALVRARRSGSAPITSVSDTAIATDGRLWYRATPGELVRLGLIDNRGWIVIGALAGFVIDYLGDLQAFDDALDFGWAWAWSGAQRLEPAALVLLAAALLGFLLFVVASSIAAAWVRFWDFRLVEQDGRLISERGLFTRIRGSARPERLQALVISESPLFRLFGRRALGAAVVGGLNVERGEPPLRWLAPILPPATATALLARVQPGFDPAALIWTPLHTSAFRRVLLLDTLLVAVLAGVSGYLLGWWGLAAWALVPIGLWHARRYAEYGAVGLSATHLVLRGGVLDASSTLIARDRIHAVELRQSPFDRRHGTATLVIDGIAPVPHPGRLHLPYLALDQARALARALRSRPRPERTPAANHAAIEATQRPALARPPKSD